MFNIADDSKPCSIFENGEFADESFAHKHDEVGLIGMCKRSGYANTNECQFYVTMGSPITFMDGVNVVFGRVIHGMRVFKLIEKIETHNQKPLKKIEIEASGIYKA